MRTAKRSLFLVAAILATALFCVTGCADNSSEEGKTSTSIKVPSVVGLSEWGAKSVLEREGLVTGDLTSEEVSETGGQPTILRQNPKPGTLVEAGAPVDLVLSIPAVAMAEVPDVSHGGTTA